MNRRKAQSMAAGIAIGAGIGLALHNVAVGAGLALAFGAAFVARR